MSADTQACRFASPIGLLVITGDGTGILSVRFVDGTAAPSPPPGQPYPTLQACVEQLDAYFAGALRAFSVPLHPQGTPFELRVWAEVLKIEFGQTRSYGDIARALGDLKGVRAVGRANGHNPIPILIPCHRVIGSGGDLVGYGGGLWRKEWLLAHEGRPAQPRLF